MYIARWLAAHPLIALWTLTIVAIILNVEDSDTHTVEVVTTSESVSETAYVVTETKNESVLNTFVKRTQLGTDVKGTDEVGVPPSVPLSSNQQAQAPSSIAVINNADLSVADRDLLRQARTAFWNKDLNQSAVLYEELVSRTPTLFRYKGELGNVYWAQNRRKEAAQLYAEIAIPMLDKGLDEPVVNMLDLISLYFPEEAGKISAHLHN